MQNQAFQTVYMGPGHGPGPTHLISSTLVMWLQTLFEHQVGELCAFSLSKCVDFQKGLEVVSEGVKVGRRVISLPSELTWEKIE